MRILIRKEPFRAEERRVNTRWYEEELSGQHFGVFLTLLPEIPIVEVTRHTHRQTRE